MATKDSGIALVAILWIVVLLSGIAAIFTAQVRSHFGASRAEIDESVAEALADAGIYDAVWRLLDPHATPRVDGTPHTLRLANREIVVSIQDELGKIDLNLAGDELLLSLFRSASLSAAEASALLDRIGDWRDGDRLRRLNGAEESDYAARGLVYGPRNAPFRSVSELQLVLGMTAALFERIEPALTVHAQRPFVDASTAPRVVLSALPGMNPERLKKMVAARSDARSKSAASVVALNDDDRAGRPFSIRSTVSSSNGNSVSRSAVLRLTGDPGQPYWVQAWIR